MHDWVQTHQSETTKETPNMVLTDQGSALETLQTEAKIDGLCRFATLRTAHSVVLEPRW